MDMGRGAFDPCFQSGALAVVFTLRMELRGATTFCFMEDRQPPVGDWLQYGTPNI